MLWYRRSNKMDEVDKYAKIIWDYMLMNQELKKTDIIIGMGSYDSRTAERAANLYLAGYAPYVLFSGDGRNSKEGRPEREADLFARIAQEKGVPADRVLIESNSRNTGENIGFSRELLKEKGISVRKVLVVHKPFMERRIYAAMRKQWSEVDVIVTSPVVLYEDYTVPSLPRNEVVGSIAGDLERMTLYAEKGFQIPQEIPEEVIEAAKKLRAMGFVRRMT